jgi:hypothetical protein
MIIETLQIGAGALLLCSPMWGAYLLQTWLDKRPTPEQRRARTRANVLRRREQINRRGW